MTFLIILAVFLFLCIIGLTIFLFYIMNKAGEKINAYDRFYEQTSDEMEDVLKYLDEVINSKTFYSQDPALRDLMRGLKLSRDIIRGYVHAETKEGSTQDSSADSRQT